MLYVKHIPDKGRAVFTDTKILKDEIVETAYTLIAHITELENTALKDYYFEFPDNTVRVVLGKGTLINHSISNANIRKSWKTCPLMGDVVDFIATRDINEHEELLHNYNFDPGTEPSWVNT